MSKRPGLDDNADSERLPWLEPFSEPAARPSAARPKAVRPAPGPRSNGPLWGMAVLLLVAAAAGGGYWLGLKEDVPAPAAIAERRSAPAPVPAAPAELPGVNAVEATAEPEPEPTPEPVTKIEPPKKVAERAAPSPPRKAKLRRADTRRTQYDRVVAKQREAVRTWPKMPSPGTAGQVIQLGAFSTRARAEAAYRERIARYPLLSGMPQVIVPVITKPRGQVLYVLRLGTQTREQSQVVCSNLRRSGDHCLVIG
ncbi:MAG TPA: SPOR domain-containing protein [Sphingomicrobium sp.]|nr:SPOR domain-containing protein [Sphingomicrobium sp.]